MNINIRNGNVIDELRKIPSESVDCIVSSPPYYGLRSYKGADTMWGGNPECEHEWMNFKKTWHSGTNAGTKELTVRGTFHNNFSDINGTCSKCGAWKGQLGLEPTYQLYVEHLMLVMKELKRVLKKTGTLFWNIGDTYSGSGGAGGDYNPGGIREGQPKYKQEKSEIPSKSLMGIPERFMIAMLDDGWVLRNKLPWIKMNAMPSSKKDGFTPKWEYVYFFTKKSQSYYFDLDSIRKPLAESSIKRISQENIPNQFKSGKSAEFAETNPVNNIPKIINNMHKKYNSKYQKTDDMSLQYSQRTNVIEEARQKSYMEAENLFPDDLDKQKEYIKNVHDHLGNSNGANPGDVLFDDTIYDLYTDPNIQSAFVEYLEQERPELLMPSVLDIPTMPHSFSHFAVFPTTLVEPLIKAGCPKEVCSKCGKPKMPFREKTGRTYDSRNGEYTDEGKYISRKVAETNNVSESSVFRTDLIQETKTVMKPSCSCNVNFIPGTVLDPFAGSGTVGVVAKKQGKSAILIEISPEYVEIIKNRLEIEASGTNMNVKFVETASISSLEEDE